jgi:hypothetical protein
LLIQYNHGDSTKKSCAILVSQWWIGLECGKGGAMIETTNERLLLCRPEGGLNDILSEIGKCVAYARKYNRLLIVDTNHSDTVNFKDAFSNYFSTSKPNIFLNSHQQQHLFDSLDVMPPFLKGRVTSSDRSILRAELGKATPISFDFAHDYTEPLLVHQQNGQQKKRNAMIALGSLKLNVELANELQLRLTSIGGAYSAFHIRHTDYETDYVGRVRKLAAKISGQIFVATDNRAVVDFFKTVFGEKRIITFSKLPDVAGKPLHYDNDFEDMKRLNREAILDVLTLALAKRYIFFPRETGKFALQSSYSGFSVLAARLRNSPKLLKQILPNALHEYIQPAPSWLSPLQKRWLYF